MRYVLGIDQGGSKTHAIIANEAGELCGLGCGAGACHSTHGMQAAMSAISDATQQACKQAGVELGQVERVAAGLTGVDWPHEAGLLRDALHDLLGLPAERITVVNDCLIALRAATTSASGCILCAGSGLNCAVRKNPDEEYVFGFYVEERCQGGYALGARTLQTVFDAESALVPPTALTEAVLAHMGYQTVDELLQQQVTTGLDKRRVLDLPKVVEHAALDGDAVAADVLETFGRDIARYVTAGLRRFRMTDDAVEVVLSGSVFKCQARVLQQSVEDAIHAAAPHARIVESEYEPVIGAMLMALDRLPHTDGAAIQEHIKRDAKRFYMVR